MTDRLAGTNTPRMVNRERHLCGCITVFDTVGWRSLIAQPCDFHRAVIDAHPEADDRALRPEAPR